MKYKVSTIAWGEWHLNIFLNWNLKSLCSGKNILFFKSNKVKYKIYTKRADLAKIKNNKFFKILSTICKFDIEVINDITLHNPIAIHHKYWLKSKNDADKSNEIIIFNPPDVIWSSNSFFTIQNKIKSGKKALFMSYSRSIAETLLDDLINLPEDFNFDSEQLVKLSIQNMHPLTISYNFKSNIIPDHSEQIFSFSKNGYSVTSLVRELFVITPNLTDLSKDSLPVQKINTKYLYKCSNSREIFAISFAPLLQCFDWYLGSSSNTILNIGHWWVKYDSPINNFIFSNTAFFNYKERFVKKKNATT